MKTENTPTQTSIAAGETIELRTRFGDCSRGKSWGKFFPGQNRAKGDFEWVPKRGKTLILEGPGYYIVGSDDGFSRKARAEFTLISRAQESARARAAREGTTVTEHTA